MRAALVVRLVIPVPTPFPEVAAHVVNAEAVRFFGSNTVAGIHTATAPGYGIEAVRATVKIIRPVSCTAGGVFPFRLSGQSVAAGTKIADNGVPSGTVVFCRYRAPI